MSNETIKTAVPLLRFPEFREAGEWEEKELGEYLLKHPEYGINATGVPFSDSLPTYLRITDISDSGHFLRHQKVSVEKEVTENNYLTEGDIVLARTGASVGKSYKYQIEDGELVFAGFLIRVKPNESKLNSEFLSQFLSTDQYWQWVAFSSTRSGQPGINGNEYASMPLSIPPVLEEQQKIAACLSSLDDLLTAQTAKLAALQAHKRGLLQGLFPAAGETVPKLRFPEFREAGEWEERTLGELLEFKNGINASKEQYGKGIKFINVLDILNNYFITHDVIIGSVNVSPEMVEKFSVGYGDILFQRSSETQEEVGTANVYLDKEQTVTFGGFVIRGKKIADYEPLFLNKLLQTKAIRNSISSKAGGSTRYNIGQESLSSTEILLPSLDEQQKIAACLSSLDDRISAQTAQLAALQLHKKGLMQALFPTTPETTA